MVKCTSEVKIVEAAWSSGLLVRAEGTGTVAHAGVVLPRLLADRVGLTSAFRDVLARRGFVPGRDRGRAVTDTVSALAAGDATAQASATVFSGTFFVGRMLLLALATVVLALFGYRLAGQTLRARPSRSSRMIATTSPLGPMFFCAPA